MYRRCAPALLLVVCSCAGTLSSQDRLTDAVTVFCDALRWQQYDQASGHLSSEMCAAYLDSHDRLADLIDVTDLEVTRRTMAGDRKTAQVVVAVSWIAKNNPVVTKTVLEHRWERRGDSWLLTRERLLRGEPFPRPLRARRPAPASAPREVDAASP